MIFQNVLEFKPIQHLSYSSLLVEEYMIRGKKDSQNYLQTVCLHYELIIYLYVTFKNLNFSIFLYNSIMTGGLQ